MSTLEGFGSIQDWSHTIWELHPPVPLLQGHIEMHTENTLLLLSLGPKSLFLGTRIGNWGLPHGAAPSRSLPAPGAAETAFHTRTVQSCFLESAGLDAEGLSQPLGLGRQSPFPSQNRLCLCFQHWKTKVVSTGGLRSSKQLLLVEMSR